MNTAPNRETTKPEAIALAATGWWKEMDPRDAFRAQANALLAMPFDEFHRIAQEALGRSVWTHEFADPDGLLAELDGETPTPIDPNQHAIDSLSAMLLAKDRDPDKVIIAVVAKGEGSAD